MSATLIYPHQLLLPHPGLTDGCTAILIEDPLFDQQFRFHQKKMLFQQLSMGRYAELLERQGYNVLWHRGDATSLCGFLGQKKIKRVSVAYLADDWLQQRLESAFDKQIEIQWVENTSLLLGPEDARRILGKHKHYAFLPFYRAMRERLDLLLDDGKPRGGKWTYDVENRKKWPKSRPLPDYPMQVQGPGLSKAIKTVEERYGESYGDCYHYFFPSDHNSASKWLDEFLIRHFAHFGPYEDAIVETDSPLHHSLLSPLLNVGLLTPQEVVNRALDFAHEHEVPLPSLEGFLRQIIGWREFIHALYLVEGRRQRCSNYWQHKRSLPESFWTAKTGLLPVDNVIGKVKRHAYSHHIERLMVMSNIMQLCEIHPDDAYRWFMELYIDAYDWVMVPNVYGMGLFADGGLMTTKPYISGSNYLRKMSNYPSGEWCEIWDGLYWRFIAKHREFFESNPRLSMMARHLDRMGDAKLDQHLRVADSYLERLL